MSQVTMIGSQELYTRLISGSEKDTLLQTLLQTAGKGDWNVSKAGILDSQEVYNPYGLHDYDHLQPHKREAFKFVDVGAGLLSLTLWQVMHVETVDSYTWQGVYLYRLVERIEDIFTLSVYRVKQIAPGALTYVTFPALPSSTVRAYRAVEFHPEMIAAPEYLYQYDARFDSAMARMDSARIASEEAAHQGQE